MDGAVEKVKILGNNSAYIFYLLEEDNIVKITPINGIHMQIEGVPKNDKHISE